MRSRHLLFLLVALAQLAVPAWMIVEHERVLRKGEVFLFKTAPIDPRDPFRGEYVQLDFEVERDEWRKPDWFPTDANATKDFAVINADSAGFARIVEIVEERPGTGHYVDVTLKSWGGNAVVSVSLPFDRFYLKEGDGKRTEEMLAPQWNNGTMTQPLPTHAVVRVLNGRAVIEDLVVDGRSIHDWLNE